MKYYIHIEYTAESATSKTAKLTLLDQKNKKLLNKVPVSLPNALFDKNKAPFYFGMNKESGKYNAPSVSEIDFKTRDFKEFFEDNSSFMPLYEFTNEEANFYETFNKNNKNYVMYKKQILCFPQYDDDLLGVDENALILHENNFKIFAEAMSKATEVSFDLTKPRFNLFNNFEDRKTQKYSDINKIHTIVKEIEKNKASVIHSDSLVNQRLKEARRDRFNQITGRSGISPDISSESVSYNETPLETKKTERSVENKKEMVKDASVKQKESVSHKTIFIAENNKNIVSDYFYNVNNNADRERLQRQRNIDFMFMMSMYNYFILQKLSFNNKMLNEAFKKIPGGESIKSSSFFSNENGFFIQMFSDNQKTEPLGTVSFDFETKTLGMQNEDSLLTLNPSENNPYILSLEADYGVLKLSGEIMNVQVDQDEKFEDYRTFGNIRILNQSNNENIPYSFGAKYFFKSENNEGLPKIDYALKESETPVDIYLAYQAQKDKIGNNFNQFLTSMDLYFEGKNEEQFLINKSMINANIDENVLNDVSKEIESSPDTFHFIPKENDKHEEVKSAEQISFEEERRLYNEEQERIKAEEKAKYDIGDKFDDEIMAALSQIKKEQNEAENSTAVKNDDSVNDTPAIDTEHTSETKEDINNSSNDLTDNSNVSEEDQSFNDMVMDAIQKHQNETTYPINEDHISASELVQEPEVNSKPEPEIKNIKTEIFPDFTSENCEIFDVGNNFVSSEQDVYIPQTYEASFPETSSGQIDYSDDYSRYMSNEETTYDYEDQRRQMEEQARSENQRTEEARQQEERRMSEQKALEDQRRKEEENRREEQRREDERLREEQQRREEERRAEEERQREEQRREEERRIENERNNNSSFRM